MDLICQFICFRLNLDDDEKKEIGKMCKFLIDYGRIKALEKQDFSCKLVSYVKEDVTLENVCLLATKAKWFIKYINYFNRAFMSL